MNTILTIAAGLMILAAIFILVCASAKE